MNEAIGKVSMCHFNDAGELKEFMGLDIVKAPKRFHKKKRIAKKWRKRYGIFLAAKGKDGRLYPIFI